MFYKIAMWTAALVAGLAVGCGGGGDTAAPLVSADPAQKAEAQSASAAGGAVEHTAEYSADALVESGAPGATSCKTDPSAPTGTTGTLNFQASVTLTVTLGAPNHPNASGQFQVTATGTLTGNAQGGQAAYAVQVLWLTDGAFTDPCSGAQARITAGSQESFSVTVQWTKTDDQNWSIQATYDLSGAGSGTVTNQGRTWDVTGTVTAHASEAFSCTAGTYAFTLSVNGLRSIVLTSGAEVHTVTISIESLSQILVDVDGVTFGPLTLGQIIFWFALDCAG